MSISLGLGAECFTLCTDITNNPGSNPFPNGTECSRNEINYKAKRKAYERPPANYAWNNLGVCTVTPDEPDVVDPVDPDQVANAEYLNELIEYQIAILSLLIGVILGGCFVGVVRYAL